LVLAYVALRMHSRYVFLVFVFAVSLGAHAFVASWLLGSIPSLRRHRSRVFAVAFGLCALTAVARFASLVARSNTTFELLGVVAMTEWMIVILGAIPLALVHLLVLATWIGRAKPREREDEAENLATNGLTRRQAVERVAGAVALGASTAVLGWGSIRGRHAFVIEEVPVRIPGLPRALDGYTIAQISDLHAGIFVGDRELGEGLSRLRETRPDLVVVTGDLVDFDPRYAEWLAGSLGRIAARDGIYAVLGNHDYYAGYETIARAMRTAGVDLLVNQGRTIRRSDGGGFALLGVDDLSAGRWSGSGPDLNAAIVDVSPDAPRILLAHQPQYFDHVAGRVSLQLSGHTHGGQVNPGFRPGELFFRYLSGRYERKGSTLWVNRGFGVAGPPTRVGAPPEVTKIVLVAA
jgi:predicted MPP superfamily phosphohydrolase